MSSDEDDDIFSDDDLLEEFSRMPPRDSTVTLTQGLGGRSVIPTSQYPKMPPKETNQTAKMLSDIELELIKAQGEASMLRDKLNMFRAESEQERRAHLEMKKELEQLHQEKLNKIKADLQKAEDEKKFLIMADKAKSRSLGTSPASAPIVSNGGDDVNTKRRKLEESNKQYVVLNPNRVFPDEVGLFIDSLLQHILAGSDMTTIEILNQIRLEYIMDFRCKTFELYSGGCIGKSIVAMLRMHKQSSIKLDKLVDLFLETMASLIKEISYHEKEHRTALPFLVALMFQAITFRPSAVHVLALKDVFQFTGDLVRTNRRVLKRPIRDSELLLHVEPEIFQYELIDVLVVLYSFDILERAFKVLQTQSIQFQMAFIDENVIQTLDDLTRYSLTISYQPILNVVYSSVEILNSLANVLLEIPQLIPSVSETWWNNVIYRLYPILHKDVSNMAESLNDPDCLSLPNETNVYGLIRNIGNNYTGALISKLVSKDQLQATPEVILKDFPEENGITEKALNVEWWCLRLKIAIIKLFEKHAIIAAEQPIERELIKNLARLLANEQELLITVLLGQDSENVHVHFDLLSQLVKLIFHLWKSGRVERRHLKEVEPELTICLWRIVFGTEQEDTTDALEMSEHKKLVDRLDDLRLQEDVDLFEDSFDGDVPKYIQNELQKTSYLRCQEIMSTGVEETTKEMAKAILEGITSMEDADALYLAMYHES